MKRLLLPCASLLVAGLFTTGCGTPGSYQQSHSTAGAIIGAGAGTIIGAAYGRPAEGALAGALIGGAAGAASGENIDQKATANAQAQAYYQSQANAQAQAAANPPLSKTDVISMSKSKVSDDVIVNKIQSTSFVQPLTAQDLIELKNEGVSDRVANAMIGKAQNQSATASAQPANTTIVNPAPATVTTYYYVDPAPYPWTFYWGDPGPYYRRAPPPPRHDYWHSPRHDPGPGPRPGPGPGPHPGPGPGPHPGPRPSPPR